MGFRQLAVLAAMLGLLSGPGASTALARQATPAPATPAAQPAQPEPTPPPTAAPPSAATAVPAEPTTPPEAAEPAAATDVVTLVAWYVTDPSGEFINILPIAVEPSLVASAQPGAQPIGEADFPDDGAPSVTLGDTTFSTYARSEGDIPERWTWFDDVESARPATLVMQVIGDGGPYAGYFGTVTFISRDEGGVGGVIVFALRPPGSSGSSGSNAATDPAGDGVAGDAASAGAGDAGDMSADAPSDAASDAPADAAAEPAA